MRLIWGTYGRHAGSWPFEKMTPLLVPSALHVSIHDRTAVWQRAPSLAAARGGARRHTVQRFAINRRRSAGGNFSIA